MKQTLTLLCPESMFYAGNHLAAAKGKHIDDLLTFPSVNRTKDGIGYCLQHVQVSEKWVSEMAFPVTRPDHDPDMLIDLVAAQAALDSLTIVSDFLEDQSPPTGLVAAFGVDLDALYGLSPVVDQ